MQDAAPDHKQLYEQTQSLNASLQLHVLQLTQQLQQLQKMIFGSRQERFIPTAQNDPQLSLDMPAETVVAVSVTSAQKISYIRQGVTVEHKPLQHSRADETAGKPTQGENNH